MATMNISLPDPMKEWFEAQAETGRYSNASDYVRDLIRRDQEQSGRVSDIAPSGRERLLMETAIAEANKGEFISAEAIHRWMEQLDTNPDVVPPEPDVFVRRSI